MNTLLALGALILAFGLLCLVGGVRLVRRGSRWGTTVLALVPPALLVGGYLAYSGATADSAPAEPRNPVAADAASIARGESLFVSYCAGCHGIGGRGDGPQAAALNQFPSDMTRPDAAYRGDGYLFTAITNGRRGTTMVGWGETLTAQERWDLVNYLRQLNPLTANGATPPASPAR